MGNDLKVLISKVMAKHSCVHGENDMYMLRVGDVQEIKAERYLRDRAVSNHQRIA